MSQGDQTQQHIQAPSRKRAPVKPAGYIEDPEERKRFAREMRGSIPDIISQEELQRRRWES